MDEFATVIGYVFMCAVSLIALAGIVGFAVDYVWQEFMDVRQVAQILRATRKATNQERPTTKESSYNPPPLKPAKTPRLPHSGY
jgi:hypothetical protein